MKSMLKTGMIYTAIGQYSNVLIQLIMNMVLSRLIPVAEFGIVANVQVFLVFFQTLVTSGFGPAIIQNKELEDKDYGILLNFMTLFSIILAVLFGSSGKLIALIYENDVYTKLFWLMSIIVFTEGMKVVTTAVLNKALRFKEINLILLVSNLLGAVVGIVTALNGFGIYALILSTSIPSLLTMILNLVITRIPFTTELSFEPVKKVWRFARNQIGFTVLNYFSRNTDNLLIGKFLGPKPIANYQKGYQLITMPNTVFLGVISPVLQPILAKHQDDVKIIREAFLRIVHVLALIAFPLTAFMVINAQEIILLLFGPRWMGAILPFQILAFSIWAQMLTSATGSIFMARNHSQTLLFNGVISTILILTFTIIGLLGGSVQTVALGVCFAYILNFFTSYYILMTRVLEGRLGQLGRELLSPLTMSTCVTIVMIGAKYFIKFDNFFVTLLIRGIIWMIIVAVYILVSGEVSKIKQALRDPE